MSEAKDPAIKLFGKTIPLPETPVVSGGSSGALASSSGDIGDDGIDHSRASPTNSSRESNTKRDEEEQETEKDTLGENPNENMEDGAPTLSTEEVTNPDAASRTSEESDTPRAEKDATSLKASKSEEEQSETSNSQEKTLKKPDKILPCPRCNSMDTKFCYYNNYNVNQPRHFCKNCQRYWTAGGTMRNVPVGAGRRKNKNSSHYRQITVAEALQAAQTDMPNGVHHPALKKPNGTVLAFGSDAPLCESMASVLNLADKTMQDCTRNGFHRPEELRIPVPYASGEKGDDHSNKSPVMSTKSMDDASINRQQEQAMQNCQSFPPQVPYYPGAPWPFPWNPVQWSSPVPPPPAFCPPGFTMPFYPAAAYWGCTVSGAWNIPWLPQPSSPNSMSPNSGPNSPTLGKHSREENMLKINDSGGEDERGGKENGKEKCLWVPKTLRIDDPDEAAKSSIWTTLGIKNDKAESVREGGLFRTFPSKGDGKDHSAQNSTVLQANPAALSRSLNFHETS